MFGVGFGEIVVICLVALFFLGPDDFVRLTRAAARAIRQVRVFKQEIKDSIDPSPGDRNKGDNGAGPRA